MMKKKKRQDGKIIPGAESFYLPGGECGCLLIHGISSSPQQMRLMGEYLAAKGITVHGTRLAGHGTRLKDLHRVTYEDWLRSAEEGLVRLEEHCSSIFCAGLSLGGVISLRLTSLYPQRIRGVVTICSPYRLHGFLFNLVPYVKGLIRNYYTGPTSINKPGVEEICYSHHSVPAVFQLMKLTALVREDLARIKAPVLIFGARRDKVIDPLDPARYFEEIASPRKELIWLDHSDHVAVLDYDRELIFERTATFIKEHSPVSCLGPPPEIT